MYRNNKNNEHQILSSFILALLAAAPALGQVIGDFDGNGKADVAIGMPRQDVNGISNAGCVQVVYGASQLDHGRADIVLNQDVDGIPGTSELNDEMGAALAVGDFNGDGIDDLAIGCPGEDPTNSGENYAGAVIVVYGVDGTGLEPYTAHMLHQNSEYPADMCNGVTVEGGDEFGAALAAGDFDGDGYDDLAIGVPGETHHSITEAGMVHELFGSDEGITTTGNECWSMETEDSGYAVDGEAAAYDNFGMVLEAGYFNDDDAADLAIGVPYEDINGHSAAGAVHVLYGVETSGLSAAGNERWHRDWSSMVLESDNDGAANAEYFGFALAAGDYNGDGNDDLAIGAPRAEVGGHDKAGSVNVLYGSDSGGLSLTGDQFWSQDETGIIGRADGGDQFGRALVAGDFDGDGYFDLAIGVPYEDLRIQQGGTIEGTGWLESLFEGGLTQLAVLEFDDAGAVAVLYGGGSPSDLRLTASGNQLWCQGTDAQHPEATSYVDGELEAEDTFGFALAAGDFDGNGRDDLVVGVPEEDWDTKSNCGAINAIYGNSNGLAMWWKNQFLHRGSLKGPLQNDARLGQVLSSRK